MTVVLIDNRDSFVHNLARYVRVLGRPTEVVRSDEVTVEDVAALAPDIELYRMTSFFDDVANIAL